VAGSSSRGEKKVFDNDRQNFVLQNEIPEAANVAAAKLAKRYGVRVIFNAAPARPLGPDLAGNIDLLVVNAVEAEMLCGVAVASLRAATEAAAVLSNRVAAAVVTAGGLGLSMAVRGKPPYAEAAHPVKLVDTHGAGDLFIGALAARWASGMPVAQAIQFANAAAALFVSTPADQKKAVTSDQVTRFLSEFHHK
jgi:ribokinase